MTATFGVEYEETLTVKANHFAAKTPQNAKAPNTPLDTKPDCGLLLASNEIYTPQPMTTLPSDSILIDPAWGIEIFPTMTSPEQSADETYMRIHEKEQELHQQS